MKETQRNTQNAALFVDLLNVTTKRVLRAGKNLRIKRERDRERVREEIKKIDWEKYSKRERQKERESERQREIDR